ncbi:hypothetical protein Purlil1_6419 [Purpureocillium lilacinum]|uniref:Uncharacterized protein n=1 Tax=Purpureocillium lilacinum TaxID=33203 RepID=A0ABR0BZN4_PURLI|nr:hypothetical protein Purlil1_6419 [Purpureocillium lilacinum]
MGDAAHVKGRESRQGPGTLDGHVVGFDSGCRLGRVWQQQSTTPRALAIVMYTLANGEEAPPRVPATCRHLGMSIRSRAINAAPASGSLIRVGMAAAERMREGGFMDERWSAAAWPEKVTGGLRLASGGQGAGAASLQAAHPHHFEDVVRDLHTSVLAAKSKFLSARRLRGAQSLPSTSLTITASSFNGIGPFAGTIKKKVVELENAHPPASWSQTSAAPPRQIEAYGPNLSSAAQLGASCAPRVGLP